MLFAAFVKVGGLKRAPPEPASIWPMLSPELKPARNAALEAVVAVCALPGNPGASCNPDATNVFFRGEFVSKAVAMVPGKTSAKMPMPPRITVLPAPRGCHAKPKRGSHAMRW